MAKDQTRHLSPIISGSMVMPDRRHSRSALHVWHKQKNIRMHFFFFSFFFNFPGTRLTCQVISSHTRTHALHYSPHLPPFLLLCPTASSFHPGAWKPLQENCFQLCAVTGAQLPCSCSQASAPQIHRMGGEGLLQAAGCLQKQSPTWDFGGHLWMLPAAGMGHF